LGPLEQSIQAYFEADVKEIEIISNVFKPTVLPKGRTITKKGQICKQLAFVKQGLLRIYATKGDKEITQWICTPGTFATELSGLLFNQPSRWTIEAMTDCELYVLNENDYKSLPNIIEHWTILEKLFIGKCFTMLEDRVFSFLSMSAEERYLMLLSNHKELIKEVPQQYLASMLGMTPETFSRLRKKTIS
jgi:CRP-like cAMP-binding protein